MSGEPLAKKSFLDDIFLILATLFYRRVSLKGRTRFQKTVFLLKEKFDVSFTFKFRPYYYGPYSEDLADMISILKAVAVIEEKPQRLGVGIIRYNYQLAEKGKTWFNKFRQLAEEETLEKLGKLKGNIREINRMTTRDLISTAKALID